MRSEQDPSTYYVIPYRKQNGQIQLSSCSCIAYAKTRDRCKHMFLAVRYTSQLPGPQSDAGGESASEHADKSEEDGSSDPSAEGIEDGVIDVAMGDLPSNASSTFRPQQYRLQSESPPRPEIQAIKDKRMAEGQAIQAPWDGMLETLRNVSIESHLAANHDAERMRNMVAQLQSIISTWPEALGAKEGGAAL